jgi:hypothetical protein
MQDRLARCLGRGREGGRHRAPAAIFRV